jgi:WD40 repeat protein
VFHSGIVWAPKQSFIRQTYAKQPLIRIVGGHRVGWGACEHTIRGHSSPVTSVAVSPDNRHIVSGSHDSTVRIWSFSTDEEESVFPYGNVIPLAVAISPDNRLVVISCFLSRVA